MDRPKVMSGQQIVAKGVTKIDATLPEIGLKDVTPNGSWLEQKQIQAALEARKHLIEVERIEKIGTLSHAIWRDDLKMAEVTQKSGGYWQFLGHNIGKTIYLKPEEVLFLLEVNCLLLKHNDIIVSLQKAYSLLLNDSMSIIQYRVYSSLSKLGYKVFRHKVPITNKEKSVTDKKTQIVNETKDMDQDYSLNCHIDNMEPSIDSTIPVNSENVNTISEPASNAICNQSDTRPPEQGISSETEYSEGIKLTSDETIIEVEEKDFSNIDESKQNTTEKITEPECSNVNLAQDIESQLNLAQDNIIESSNCQTIDTNKQTDIVMDVDDNIISVSEAPIVLLASDRIQTNIISDQPQNETSIENITEVINADVAVTNNFIEEDNKSDPCVLTNNLSNENTLNSITIEVDSADSDIVMDLDTPKSLDYKSDNTIMDIDNTSKKVESLSKIMISKRDQTFQNYVTKLKRLTSRQCRPSDFKTLDKNFENIPDLFKKDIVTINVPEQQFLPQNIYVNNTSYLLNMEQIKGRSMPIQSPTYTSSDEANGNHVRRIRSASATEFAQNLQFVNNIRFPPRQSVIFRPFTFWRPQNNLNYVQFNMFFQRPCYPNLFFHSRFQYQNRPPPQIRPLSYPHNTNPNTSNNTNNIRKRIRCAKATHLQSIKNLAVRLKQLIINGNNQLQNIESLHRLLFAYNTRYKARLRLTKTFEVVHEENIVETIDLEDDEESIRKRPRLSQERDKFDENFNLLKQLGLKLKALEENGNVTSKHKRAMSKAIKTFNKSYDADIYMNKNFEVINKRLINLDSDSETDCVVNEPKKMVKRKKLRNPFNILKRLSEKDGNASTSNSKEIIETNLLSLDNRNEGKYSDHTLKIFNKNWLPKEDDFGRAEVVNKNFMNTRLIDSIKDEYLFNFVKEHFEDFNNWLEAKIAYLQHMEETDVDYQNDNNVILNVRESVSSSGLKSLIDTENCTDMSLVLEKLRIIKSNKDIIEETSLSIHFDVYNRDVQNFKKTNPPVPHFRIICIEESSSLPSTSDVMALHSKYDDNVKIVFAIVGISSISYLQINPIELPVYIANNDVD